jgi:hypothetical protein
MASRKVEAGDPCDRPKHRSSCWTVEEDFGCCHRCNGSLRPHPIGPLPSRDAISKAPRAAGYRGSDFVLWHYFTLAGWGVVRQGTVSHCPCNPFSRIWAAPSPFGLGSRAIARPKTAARRNPLARFPPIRVTPAAARRWDSCRTMPRIGTASHNGSTVLGRSRPAWKRRTRVEGWRDGRPGLGLARRAVGDCTAGTRRCDPAEPEDGALSPRW